MKEEAIKSGDNVLFERDMEIAEITHTQEERGGKQTKEVEILLRGTDCLLVLKRFETLETQFTDGDTVYVIIRKRYI